jgi:GABA(A) receptor-associated protein
MFSKKSVFKFKEDNTLENRKTESDKIIIKYKDRVPIIAELYNLGGDITLDKSKYLVPYDLTVSQFLYVIRKRIKLPSEQALFVFFNKSLPHSSDTLGNVYSKYRDDDGFLYAMLSLESTFG